MAGRVPRRGGARGGGEGTAGTETGALAADDVLTLRPLVNKFLDAKKPPRLDSGDMGPERAFADYHAAAGRLISALGADRRLDDIDSTDFGGLRSKLAEKMGPVSLGNEIGRIRCIFKFAFDSGTGYLRPVRFGAEFAKPTKRTMRMARHARGPRMFEPKEIKALLKGAGVQMRAMILLGLNCGLGNTDVAALPRSALDLKAGILNFPRPKTGIARRAVLWPETIAAPQSCGQGPGPSLQKRGRRRAGVHHPLWPAMGQDRSAQALGSRSPLTAVVKRRQWGWSSASSCGPPKSHVVGRSFYALRHTFRTVADEVGDRPAVDLVMGHENGADIAVRYVERIEDGRLKRVSEHVHNWAGGKSGSLLIRIRQVQ